MWESPINIYHTISDMVTEKIDEDIIVEVKKQLGVDINKDELIKAINYDRQQYEKGYQDGLNADKWIPVSERLPDNPENNDYYLVTIQCEHYDGWDDYVTGFAEWTEHGWDELSCYIGQIKVVAWMPLPEPYEESEARNE